MIEAVSTLFVDGLSQLGLKAQEQDLLARFLCYRRELLDWNTRINLTAITNPDEVLLKHFLDSLSLLAVYDQPEAYLLDIGSGAGFPGLPLKIVRPQWHVTLMEATGKKVAFLQHMIKVLHLEHIEVIQGRAEELAHRQVYRAGFDVVTARAVSSLPLLLECSAPYCRVGGSLILPKKGELTEELKHGKQAAALVGAVLEDDVTVSLPGLADGRRLLVWKQQRPCPLQFPRSWAMMMKRPLG